MKVLLVLLVGVIASVSAVSFFELVHEEWKSFKVSNDLNCFFLYVHKNTLYQYSITISS